MRKGLAILVIVVIIGLGVVVLFPYRITGYSGLDATVESVEHGYDLPNDYVYNTGTEAGLNPEARLTGDPTGIRCEIGQPEVTGTRPDWKDSVSRLDEGAGTNTTEVWEVQIVEMEMQVAFYTFGSGAADTGDVVDVTFWIRLVETSSSVFQLADESRAYIIQVETLEAATEEGEIDVYPNSKGVEPTLTTIEKDDPPDWILESGYTGNLRYFKDVKFPVRVIRASPVGLVRPWVTESQALITFEVEVLLFGHWEVVQEYNPADLPEWPDWLGALVTFLLNFVWGVVGLAASIILLWKVKNPKYIAIGLIVIWGLVAWQLGWLGALG